MLTKKQVLKWLDKHIEDSNIVSDKNKPSYSSTYKDYNEYCDGCYSSKKSNKNKPFEDSDIVSKNSSPSYTISQHKVGEYWGKWTEIHMDLEYAGEKRPPREGDIYETVYGVIHMLNRNSFTFGCEQFDKGYREILRVRQKTENKKIVDEPITTVTVWSYTGNVTTGCTFNGKPDIKNIIDYYFKDKNISAIRVYCDEWFKLPEHYIWREEIGKINGYGYKHDHNGHKIYAVTSLSKITENDIGKAIKKYAKSTESKSKKPVTVVTVWKNDGSKSGYRFTGLPDVDRVVRENIEEENALAVMIKCNKRFDDVDGVQIWKRCIGDKDNGYIYYNDHSYYGWRYDTHGKYIGWYIDGHDFPIDKDIDKAVASYVKSNKKKSKTNIGASDIDNNF